MPFPEKRISHRFSRAVCTTFVTRASERIFHRPSFHALQIDESFEFERGSIFSFCSIVAIALQCSAPPFVIACHTLHGNSGVLVTQTPPTPLFVRLFARAAAAAGIAAAGGAGKFAYTMKQSLLQEGRASERGGRRVERINER